MVLELRFHLNGRLKLLYRRPLSSLEMKDQHWAHSVQLNTSDCDRVSFTVYKFKFIFKVYILFSLTVVQQFVLCSPRLWSYTSIIYCHISLCKCIYRKIPAGLKIGTLTTRSLKFSANNPVRNTCNAHRLDTSLLLWEVKMQSAMTVLYGWGTSHVFFDIIQVS